MAKPIHDVSGPALYAACLARKQVEYLSWVEVCRRCQVCQPLTFHRLRDGGAPSLPTLRGILAWLGRPVEDFLREGARQ